MLLGGIYYDAAGSQFGQFRTSLILIVVQAVHTDVCLTFAGHWLGDPSPLHSMWVIHSEIIACPPWVRFVSIQSLFRLFSTCVLMLCARQLCSFLQTISRYLHLAEFLLLLSMSPCNTLSGAYVPGKFQRQ